MEVVVAGAGIIGLAVARELAGRGLAVTVLDRGSPGGGATRAAAGTLSPTDTHEWEGELGAFNMAAIAGWPAWADALGAETGIDPGLHRSGELRLGPPGDPFLARTRAGAVAAGWQLRELDADEIRALEPGLAVDGLTALELPGVAAVDPDRLVPALLAACHTRGVVLRTGAEVTGLVPGGVALAGGEELRADAVVLATGAWTPACSGGLAAGVRPMLGECVLVRSPGAVLCSRGVRARTASLVPRGDGSYWIGTTVLDRGFAEGPSAGSVRSILERAARVAPALEDAVVLEARGGLRPMPPDGRPLLGPAAPGVVLATGNGREGFIHAPRVAALIAAGVADGDWSAVPPSFLPR